MTVDEKKAQADSESTSAKGPQSSNTVNPPPYTTSYRDEFQEPGLTSDFTILENLRLRYPNGPWRDVTGDEPDGPQASDLVATPFFNAIKGKDEATIIYLLENNYLTLDVKDFRGTTPLLAAIEADSLSCVELLIRYGANVDDFGFIGRIYGYPFKSSRIYRTPLQLAAEEGKLAMVKLLLETYHADDSLIAPDGQLALRLAAENGHREIVDYLPSRRGGGWKRWKAKHAVAMSRAKRSAKKIGRFVKIIFFDLPKLMFWDCPYNILIKPFVKKLKWAWTHRSEIPAMLAEWMRRVGRELAKIPETIWSAIIRGIKGIPKLMKGLWKFIKSIPKALKIAAKWIWGGITTIGHAIGSIFARLVSFLHTLFTAIRTWFSNLTLQNIWEGFCYLLRAVFINLPSNLWSWLKKFEQV